MTNPIIEVAVAAGDWPPEAALRRLAEQAVAAAMQAVEDAGLRPSPHADPSPPARREIAGVAQEKVELSVVFTDDAQMQRLNRQYRGKDEPTNVLSFQQNPATSGGLLGDVVLAAETVSREAALAEKPLEHHVAHLIVHGFLHLLGYDHAAEADARKMEQIERVALKRMGISDPYATAMNK